MGWWCFGKEGRYNECVFSVSLGGVQEVKYVRSSLTVLQAHRKGHDSPFSIQKSHKSRL